eukprot:366122-Chlamydomonas_euryale.AAC.5
MVPNPDYNAGDAPLSNLADIGAVAFEVRAMRRAPLTFVAPDKLSARSAVHTGRLRPFTLAA